MKFQLMKLTTNNRHNTLYVQGNLNVYDSPLQHLVADLLMR